MAIKFFFSIHKRMERDSMNQSELMDTVTAIDIDDDGRVKRIVGVCKAGDFKKGA